MASGTHRATYLRRRTGDLLLLVHNKDGAEIAVLAKLHNVLDVVLAAGIELRVGENGEEVVAKLERLLESIHG